MPIVSLVKEIYSMLLNREKRLEAYHTSTNYPTAAMLVASNRIFHNNRGPSNSGKGNHNRGCQNSGRGNSGRHDYIRNNYNCGSGRGTNTSFHPPSHQNTIICQICCE